MKNSFESEVKGDQWLKDFLDHAHDLIQIVDVAGHLLYVNKSWSDLLEYSKEEIQGSLIYSFIDTADRSFFEGYRKQVIEGHMPAEPVVFNLRSKTGKKICVEGFVTAKMENGKALYTRGIFRDISVRLQNELRLKQLKEEIEYREQNLQQLLRNAPDAVIVINKESCISFWNPKAEELFGWTVKEVMGQPLHTLIIPVQHREAHKIGMDRYLRTGDAVVLNKTIEITALKKTGEEFYVSLSISPTSQNGEVAFIAFIRDITEQKLNQLELEKKTNELAQFTKVSHHDLQEPLRKIVIFIEMVKKESYSSLSEVSQKRFEKISESARRMSQALDDILEFASLDKEEPHVPTDLNEIMAWVLADLELVISEKGATINVDRLPTINAVPQQMHQLFYNLVNNALKFSKPVGRSVVNIRGSSLHSHELRGQAEPGHGTKYYQITVQDNGIGFNSEFAEKIFGMFERLHNKEAFSGTGIGLALCKKVVANHGGKIWAEGKPGEGATFNLLLPYATVRQLNS